MLSNGETCFGTVFAVAELCMIIKSKNFGNEFSWFIQLSLRHLLASSEIKSSSALHFVTAQLLRLCLQLPGKLPFLKISC